MPKRKIRELIAHQRILTCGGAVTVREAARRMMAAQVGAIMVTEGERLVGIFTERDALARVLAAGRDPDRTVIAEVMTPDPQTISPEAQFGRALLTMYDADIRHLPVVENGCPVGMVSVRDALGPEVLDFEETLHQREAITQLL